MGSAAVMNMSSGSSFPSFGARPVDLVHLARQTLGNKDLETEILRLFVRQSPQQLHRVRSAGSRQELRDAAHHLTGSARAIGAWGVAEGAEAIEAAARADDADMTGKLSALECALASANAFIKAMID